MKEILSEKYEWEKLRDIIDRKTTNKYYPDDNWSKVLKLFKEGFEKRYFNPLKRILKQPDKKGEGYLILTMQCVLIEAFSTYPLGLNYYPIEDEQLRDFQYNKPYNFFRSFLEDEHLFSATNKSLKKYYSAEKYDFLVDFYGNVRSSLVHSARLRNNWIVQSGDLENDDVFIVFENDMKVIYRDILQRKLQIFFDNYMVELAEPSSKFDILRAALCRKLDNIYNVEYDWSVNWWNPKSL